MQFTGVLEGQCRVKLLNYIPNGLDILYMASKTCVSSKSMKEMENKYIYVNWVTGNEGPETDEKKIKQMCNLVKMKHLSVLEHMSLTFSVANVSRALLAQYSRHRIGISLSVQSQRYVKLKADETPTVIIPSATLDKEVFRESVLRALESYQALIAEGVAPQDARSVLPSCMATQFVTTLNLRSLLDLYEKRVLASGVQYEIRSMVAAFMREAIINYSWIAPMCYVLYKERGLVAVSHMAEDLHVSSKHLYDDIHRTYRK